MSRRLRVAIVTSWYPSAEEPIAGIFVRDQAAVLAERHDVAVIAPRVSVVSRRPATWPSLVGCFRGGPTWEAGDGGIPTERPGAPSIFRTPRLSERLYERAVRRALGTQWGGQGPDLIHAHVVLPAGLAAVRVGKSLGIPVVLTEHSSPLSVHLRTSTMRSHVIEVLCGADRILAVGDGLREEILGVAPVRVDVVGNVVAPALFTGPPHPVRGRDGLRLLAVGFFKPQKRFDVLLDAVARLSPDRFAVEVVIVGEGPDEDALRVRAARLGIADRIRFVPMGPRSELLRWLGWCDALVSSSDHESFGLVIAEALATGRPVVATASGGPQTFVDGEIGMLVPPGDPEALAASLSSLPAFLVAFDPGLARERMAEAFGPDGFVRRISRVYEEVVQDSRGGKRRD